MALTAVGTVAEDPYKEARAAIERGDSDVALERIRRAYAERPDDADVRDLYAALQLGLGVRLATQAREARRKDIVGRGIGYDEEFHDSPEISAAFDRAMGAIEEVLRASPGHEKALMTKAALLFRRDRTEGRPAALEILRKVAADHPENRQIGLAIRKVERVCVPCSDTGFCPHCAGRGTRRFLGRDRKCDRCHGQGICLLCGVL